MTIDWAALQGQAADYKALPPNDYPVIITKAEAKKAGTGKDMIKVAMQVEGGPHDGRLIYNNFVISPESPNALGMFFKQMALFGMDGTFFAQNPSLERVADNLIGKRCTVTTKIRMWQGEEQTDVQGVKPWQATAGGPLATAPAGPGGSPAGAPPAPPAATSPTPQTPPPPPPAPPAPPAPDASPAQAPAVSAPPVPTPAPAPPAASDDASF